MLRCKLRKQILPKLQQALQGCLPDSPGRSEYPPIALVYVPGKARLDYLWFEVIEREGGKTYHEYRAMRLMHLASIPLNARGDQGALAEMRTVVLRPVQRQSGYRLSGRRHLPPGTAWASSSAMGRSAGETRADMPRPQAIHGAASLERGHGSRLSAGAGFPPAGPWMFPEWISKRPDADAVQRADDRHPDPRRTPAVRSDLIPARSPVGNTASRNSPCQQNAAGHARHGASSKRISRCRCS